MKNKNRKFSGLLILANLVGGLLFFPSAINAEEDLPPALASFKEEGYVIKDLPNKGGLLAFLATRGEEEPKVIYVSSMDSEFAIVGYLFDKEGNLITIEQVSEYFNSVQENEIVEILGSAGAKKNNVNDLVAAIEEEVPYIGLGNEELKPVYMFYNPDCGYCQVAWQTILMPRLKNKNIHLRIVAGGSNKALMIYDSINPAATLVRYELNRIEGRSLPFGAFSGNENILNKVKLNEWFMDHYEIEGYPTFLVPDENNNYVKIVGLKEELPELIDSQ